ncbi:hypothetical protein D3C75_220710 [compost metagenome]|nr:hypothetical protein R70331_26310 [Paenibacillus sp. FSL R7-0331]
MLTFRYIKRRKARNELIELQTNLIFYEPLYTAVYPFHEWFKEKGDFYREVISPIPHQLF